MAFDPDAFLAKPAAAPAGFSPDAYLDASLPDFLKQRGKLAADGNYDVETPGGVLRFSPTGEQLQTPEQKELAAGVGKPSTKEAGLNRLLTTLNGSGLGLTPVMAGAQAVQHNLGSAAIATATNTPHPSLVDTYREGRDQARATVEPAEKEAGVGYSLLGAVLGGGLLAPETAAARGLLGGGLGLVNAVSSSHADATRLDEGNNAAQLASDALLGTGVGLLGAGAGEALGVGAQGFRRMAGRAAAAQVAKVQAAADKALLTKTGQLGNAGMALQNALERAQNVVDNPGLAGHTPALIQEAADFLASPVAAEARGRAATNAMARVPGTVSKFDQLALERSGLQAMTAPAAVQQVADDLLAKPWVPIAERTQKYLGRQVPFEVAKRVGEEIGGTPGTAIGEVVGTGLSGLLGAPGTALANAMKDPRTRYLIGKTGAAVFGLPPKVILGAVGPVTRQLTERDLGDPGLTAEKLIATNGTGRLLGEAEHPGIEAPTNTDAGMALKREFGVLAVAHSIIEQDAAVDRGVEQIFRGREPHASSEVLATQDFGAKRMRRELADAHVQRVEEIRALATNPAALVDRLGANTAALSSVAPGIAAALTQKAHEAVTFLAREAQEPPRPGPMAPAWIHTNAERHQFAQSLETVQDPMSVLKHAAAGTLTENHVKALKAVYPLLARQMADKALERITENPKAVPYKSRLMLFMLTGVDVDGSFNPQAVARNQAAVHATDSRSTGAPQPPGERKSELTLASRMALPNQRAEMNDGGSNS